MSIFLVNLLGASFGLHTYFLLVIGSLAYGDVILEITGVLDDEDEP